uniref:Uncharacterized protein n=1 Tax=Rhizophora mucronata TaxID=61149 RepID=A0A2P2IV14_RHIMU
MPFAFCYLDMKERFHICFCTDIHVVQMFLNFHFCQLYFQTLLRCKFTEG